MKEYPDEKEKYSDKEKMKKQRVAAKFKSIQSGFKKAIDCLKKVVAVVWLLLFSIIVTICGVVTQLLQVCKIKLTLQSHYQKTTRIRFHPLVLALDLSTENQSNELLMEQEISKCQEGPDVDVDNSECDLLQPSARRRKVEEILDEKKEE